ncbi:hypothetical protein HPB50_007706 [Hyalomma asiaticum]|uniref:Uncharacterized protein n=1 Tax=Hyalomma asiaticum TaxID=266040 RepID=A0ACB7TCM6_HYAAI|nr:hypothetical protein HPB50_007706 [Hyalomma asiaticum]
MRQQMVSVVPNMQRRRSLGLVHWLNTENSLMSWAPAVRVYLPAYRDLVNTLRSSIATLDVLEISTDIAELAITRGACCTVIPTRRPGPRPHATLLLGHARDAGDNERTRLQRQRADCLREYDARLVSSCRGLSVGQPDVTATDTVEPSLRSEHPEASPGRPQLRHD